MAAAVVEVKRCHAGSKLNPLQRFSNSLSSLPRKFLSPNASGKSTRENSTSELSVSPADSPIADKTFEFRLPARGGLVRKSSFDHTQRVARTSNTNDTHIFVQGAGASSKLSLDEASLFQTACSPATQLLEEELERALMPHLAKRTSSLRDQRSIQRAWYHGDIDKDEATRLLKADGENGVFLIRTSHTCFGQYVLSVLILGHVTHVRILRNPNGSYLLTGAERNFPTLSAVIANYSLNSFTMNGEGRDMQIRLKRPCKFLPQPCSVVPE